MPNSHFWREWEGHTIAGQYRLARMWGSTEQTAVYVCDKQVVKVISREAAGPGDVIERLSRLRQLSHPQLMPVLDYGRETWEGQEYYFVVTEQASDDLAKVLAERPLGPDEAKEMLGGVISALGYLHEQGFVHGSVRPSNVMVVGDQLKISSDTAQPSGTSVKKQPGRPSLYDAPELMHDELRPESDIWMLGALIFETLTQSGTMLADASESLPTPFNAIVRGCMRRDPSTRWTLPQLQALLDGKATAEPDPHTHQYASEASGGARHGMLPPMRLFPRLMLIAAAVAVVIVCFALLGRGPEKPAAAAAPPAAAPAPQMVAPPNEPAPAASAQPKPGPTARKAHRKRQRHKRTN